MPLFFWLGVVKKICFWNHLTFSNKVDGHNFVPFFEDETKLKNTFLRFSHLYLYHFVSLYWRHRHEHSKIQTWNHPYTCPNVCLQFLNIPIQTCRFLILLQPGMFVSQKIECLLKNKINKISCLNCFLYLSNIYPMCVLVKTFSYL